MSEASGLDAAVIAGTANAEQWVAEIRHELQVRGYRPGPASSASIVLLVIGPGQVDVKQPWISTVAERLAGGYDTAMVLVDGAKISSSQLPEPVREIAFREAAEVGSRFALSTALTRILTALSKPTDIPTTPDPVVFISYRRDDSEHWAWTLARALMSRMDPGDVWIDTGSESVGADYREQIDRALSRSHLFVLLIGPGFLSVGPTGVPRLHDEQDLLRHEIRNALTRQLQIRLVLTPGAERPAHEHLPTDIRAIAGAETLTLASEHDAPAIADRIASNARAGGVSRFGLLGRGGASRKLTLDYFASQQARQRHAEHLVRTLGSYGWAGPEEDVEALSDGRGPPSITLVHAAYPRYQLVVETTESRIRLRERTYSPRRLGLPEWITRQVFQTSARTPDIRNLQQLPADLVDAAQDPDGFLGRVGRGRVSERWLKKMMSEDTVLRFASSFDETPADAVESYHRTRSAVAATGGLHPLRIRYEVEVEDLVMPRAIAVHPGGPLVAIADDRGAVLCDCTEGQAVRIERGRNFRSIAYSIDGRLAVGTARGKAHVWEPDGSRSLHGWSPYDRPRLTRRSEDDRSLNTISWSDSGRQIAVADSDAVWVWQHDDSQVRRSWPFPEGMPRNRTRGAVFLPGGRDLLVFGLFRRLWVVDAATVQTKSSFEFAGAPTRLTAMPSDPVEPTSPDAFPSVNRVAVSPTGNEFLCAGGFGQVALCDLPALGLKSKLVWHEPQIRSIIPRPNQVRSLAISPDGQRVASVADDNRLIVGSTDTWLPTHERRLDSLLPEVPLAWLPDSSGVAIALSDRVQVWTF